MVFQISNGQRLWKENDRPKEQVAAFIGPRGSFGWQASVIAIGGPRSLNTPSARNIFRSGDTQSQGQPLVLYSDPARPLRAFWPSWATVAQNRNGRQRAAREAHGARVRRVLSIISDGNIGRTRHASIQSR